LRGIPPAREVFVATDTSLAFLFRSLMKKDNYNTQMPDYIPEGQEHLHPARGGMFCDYVPDGMTAEEIRPDEDAKTVSTAPVPDYVAGGQTITEPETKGEKNA
jgi:hypothetical protein